MNTATAVPDPAATPVHPSVVAASRAVGALLARDLTVLRRQPSNFLARTVVQPLMLLFVLGYVTPKITPGHGTGAQAGDEATTLLAGMLAMVVLFQGIFAVAMPLVQEFGYTREIDDRVLSPIPVGLVAFAKVVAGALQGMLAAVVVFPLAEFVPSARPDVHLHWALLLTLAPIGALMCSSLGLFLGTALDPRSVTALFAIMLTPLLYLGCTLYPWSTLGPIRWVQALSLANPLTYVSEGFRASVTPTHHLSLYIIYPALIGFTALLLWQGIRHFRRRVVT
ncbi:MULTISPECIES: ABC transporter permease [unclassified Frankia]|uniref:ABC transporter permease n=1 Tax=unclassified Frankia TaxID=2632575 RepID=UPI002AD3D7C2|nr:MULTISPECIES: ABC transporter permease [unclassified Frankia]